MIPAFVNPDAGTAREAERLLQEDPRFDLHRVAPQRLAEAISDVVRGGAPRVLIAGGDGSIATAASVLIEHPAELAILPAGTLNHFPRSLGLPESLGAALEIAAGPSTREVDVGIVNGHAFLNTSSVGTYAMLVRRRERLRPKLTYLGAGLVAGFGLFLRMPRFSLEIEIEGRRESLLTPLIFFGVGERDLSLRSFGDRCDDGPSALHTVVIRSRSRARLLAAALATAASGIWRVEQSGQVDCYFADRCVVHISSPATDVALDGEVIPMKPPLRYEYRRNALTVVAPRL